MNVTAGVRSRLTKERGMIKRPHFVSYSVPARICLGIAISGAAVFAVMSLIAIYFM